MNPNPRVRLVLLCLAIVACLLAVVAFEDAGEVFTLTGGSWVAIALAFVAGAML